jgi:hypothetical protein
MFEDSQCEQIIPDEGFVVLRLDLAQFIEVFV